MKKLLFLSLMMSILLGASAQKTPKKITPDPMLYETYSASKIAEYQEDAPLKLALLNFHVQNFCYVSNEKPANSKEMGDILFVKDADYQVNENDIISKKKINPHHFAFTQGADQYHIYSIGTTGWYVIVNPSTTYEKKKIECIEQFKKNQ